MKRRIDITQSEKIKTAIELQGPLLSETAQPIRYRQKVRLTNHTHTKLQYFVKKSITNRRYFSYLMELKFFLIVCLYHTHYYCISSLIGKM